MEPAIEASRMANSGSIPTSTAWRAEPAAELVERADRRGLERRGGPIRHRVASSPAAEFAGIVPDPLAQLAGGLVREGQGHDRRKGGRPDSPSSSSRNRAVSTVVLPHPAPAPSATLDPSTLTADAARR